MSLSWTPDDVADRLGRSAAGLICYYPLDEEGGPVRCALSGMPSAPVGAVARAVWEGGHARRFPGGADYVPLPVSGPSGGSAFTVALWVRPSALVQYQRIVSCLSPAPFNGWEIYAGYAGNTGEIVFQVGNAGTLANSRTAAVLAIGSGAYVVVTFSGTWVGSGTNQVSGPAVYVNGMPQALIASGTGTITAGNSNQTLHLGRYIPATGYNWRGDMAAYGLWSRVLSPGEVTALYAAELDHRHVDERTWVWMGGAGTEVVLAGSAVAVSTAAGAVTVAVPVTGSAAASSAAPGAVSVSVSLAASAVASALASAGVVVATDLAGTAAGSAAASGTVALTVPLAGAVLAQAAAVGDLVAGDGWAGSAVAHPVAAGNLVMDIPVVGAAQAHVSVAGGLATIIGVQGAAAAATGANGAVQVAFQFGGAALANALAQGGTLTLSVPLAGAALAQARAVGAFATGALDINPLFEVEHPGLSLEVEHPPLSLAVAY